MRKIGDVIRFPDQAPYGKHRGHEATVIDADRRDARIKCACGDIWWVAQRDGDGNIVDGDGD